LIMESVWIVLFVHNVILRYKYYWWWP